MGQEILGYLIAAGVVAAGILIYWRLKWASRKGVKRDTFDRFFLGGGTVGAMLTENNNWGLCFAFANAIWYFAFLGYYYGPWSFLLQLPWTFSVVCLALLLRKYMTASADGTVHGFIAHTYGVKASIIAAIATIIGYTINCGFEIFYSAHLLAYAFSAVNVELILAIALAVFIGAYCTAGGYMASVVTDRYQNRMGVLALLILIGLLTPQFIAVNGSWNPFLTSHVFPAPPWHFVVGVSVFAFFFNFVDMANWQSLAANRKLPDEKIRGVRWYLVRSAALQVFAPGLLGAWLGVMLKVIQSDLADEAYFKAGFEKAFPHIDPVSGLLLGIIVLGFVSVTITSAGSYLVAAMQTLTIDLFKRRTMLRYFDPNTPVEEKTAIEDNVLYWVKRNVIAVVIFMTLVFAGLYYGLERVGYPTAVFSFQFVMYGAAVTLVPSVLSKLMRKDPLVEHPKHYPGGFASILVGLAFVFVPFIVATFFWEMPEVMKVRAYLPTAVTSDLIDNLSPLSGLIASTVVFLWRNRSRA